MFRIKLAVKCGIASDPPNYVFCFMTLAILTDILQNKLNSLQLDPHKSEPDLFQETPNSIRDSKKHNSSVKYNYDAPSPPN